MIDIWKREQRAKMSNKRLKETQRKKLKEKAVTLLRKKNINRYHSISTENQAKLETLQQDQKQSKEKQMTNKLDHTHTPRQKEAF